MGRTLLIVVLASVLLATGVAGAAPTNDVRLPISVGRTADPVTSVVVEKGDHLWKISARHLDEVAPEADVAPYWQAVVDVNTPHLRSGDPDLIYPGEVVELPATSGQP
jgi:nucleoid-associated protein YgaU